MRIALAVLLAAGAASAHQPSVSFSELRVDGARVDGTVRIALVDLRTQLPVDPAHLDARALGGLASMTIRANGKPCVDEPARAALDGQDGVAISLRWTCPATIEALYVRVGLLDTLPPGHTHLSKISWPDGFVAQRIATADEPWFEVRETRSFWRDSAKFLALGVEHIFTGYDHIAFLVALLLLGGTLRALIGIVSAFTVAHSITLALATLEVVSPRPAVIEPLIALSIVYVGVENLWALRRHAEARALGHRWMLTFAFGLVHGFGFASVLRELHLPRATLATGLVSFNLGVELGQICIVAVALPLLRRLAVGKGIARALSVVIAALGFFWFVQRLG